MKNKGRRHKSGHGPYANGNCKGALCGITRDVTKMSSPSKKKIKIGTTTIDPKTYKSKSSAWVKKKWSKRVRGYFKTKKMNTLYGGLGAVDCGDINDY